MRRSGAALDRPGTLGAIQRDRSASRCRLLRAYGGSYIPSMGRAAAITRVVMPSRRARLLAAALRLEYLTVGWNIVEGLVSIWAALAAGSVALLAFGIDSFVETSSGLVLLWRLAAERRARDREEIERLDARAHKLVGLSLFALAIWVSFDAAQTLWQREAPAVSPVGIAVTTLSIAVMMWLARAKRRVAAELESRALEADSFQTTACWWLSVVALAGMGLNALLGWWWADPAAALGMTYFLWREGGGAWRSERCGCAGARTPASARRPG